MKSPMFLVLESNKIRDKDFWLKIFLERTSFQLWVLLSSSLLFPMNFWDFCFMRLLSSISKSCFRKRKDRGFRILLSILSQTLQTFPFLSLLTLFFLFDFDLKCFFSTTWFNFLIDLNLQLKSSSEELFCLFVSLNRDEPVLLLFLLTLGGPCSTDFQSLKTGISLIFFGRGSTLK